VAVAVVWHGRQVRGRSCRPFWTGGSSQASSFVEQGLVTGLKYESEVEALLKEKAGQTDKDKPLVKWSTGEGGNRL